MAISSASFFAATRFGPAARLGTSNFEISTYFGSFCATASLLTSLCVAAAEQVTWVWKVEHAAGAGGGGGGTTKLDESATVAAAALVPALVDVDAGIAAHAALTASDLRTVQQNAPGGRSLS